MSTTAKGLSLDKIIKEFDKCDLDEQVKGFHLLKEHLTKKLLDRAKEHEEESNRILSIAEEMNKDR